jgi:hypothetical protein
MSTEKEQTREAQDTPVKQHNPGDKGMNPDQRGPAQPSGGDTGQPK